MFSNIPKAWVHQICRSGQNPVILENDDRGNDMSRVMRKPVFCLCENKDADQLRGNREADQLLCFRHKDSAIPLLSKSEISSF